MNFGLFMMPVHHPEKGLTRTIKEDMETIIRADQLGFEEAWIGDHFTIPWENLPAPDLFISKALGLTKNIKLGTGVVLLQLHDPKDLAHRIAMLDYLAEGRLTFFSPDQSRPFGLLQNPSGRSCPGGPVPSVSPWRPPGH